MQKNLMTVVAVIAAAGFTSCNKEVDMFEPIGTEKATIDLNITNDNEMITRAEANVSDPSEWYIIVGSKAQIQVKDLSSQKYEAGTYSITVSNYANEAAAITANDAYYSGTNSNEELKKGSNSVTVACEKAKNCRVKADLAGLDGFAAITDAKLTVTQAEVSSRELNSTNAIGYFYAGSGKTINYQLDYKYNNVSKTAITGSILNPVAATEYQVKVVTNSNGTITLTVTYDTEFTTETAETITIDAATGERSTN